MASVASAPPVRHGKCSLSLSINGSPYRLRRLPAGPWSRRWLLTKPDGTEYEVSRYLGRLTCSCPDASRRQAQCKHQRALVALGLVSARRRGPSAKRVGSALALLALVVTLAALFPVSVGRAALLGCAVGFQVALDGSKGGAL